MGIAACTCIGLAGCRMLETLAIAENKAAEKKKRGQGSRYKKVLQEREKKLMAEEEHPSEQSCS